MARVRSALRIKSLYDQVRAQAADLANLNQTLTQRVEEQLVFNDDDYAHARLVAERYPTLRVTLRLETLPH